MVHICTTLARSKSHHFWQNKSFGRVLQEHQRHVLTFLRKKTHRKIVFQCQTNEPPSLRCLGNMKNFSTPLLKTNSYSLVFLVITSMSLRLLSDLHSNVFYGLFKNKNYNTEKQWKITINVSKKITLLLWLITWNISNEYSSPYFVILWHKIISLRRKNHLKISSKLEI